MGRERRRVSEAPRRERLRLDPAMRFDELITLVEADPRLDDPCESAGYRHFGRGRAQGPAVDGVEPKTRAESSRKLRHAAFRRHVMVVLRRIDDREALAA